MNVRSRGHAGDGRPKRREGNAVALQKIYERLALCSIGIQRNVHRIMMIEPPLIMNRALPEYRDRQRPFECLLKKRLDLPRL